MLPNVASLIVGLVLLTGGASALVRGAASLALRLGLTPLVIGLTVVAFGTSAPELVVSVQAAMAGNGGIAVGNVVGSNIANIGLILALAALIAPIAVDPTLLRRDVPVMVAVSALAAVFVMDGLLGRAEGSVLVLGLLVYVAWSVRAARAETAAATTAPGAIAAAHADAMPERAEGHAGRDLGWIAAGLGALVLGADLLVDAAVAMATAFGLSDAVIGLTIVAVGTSLPEMATSVVAAVRGQSEIAAGNVIGSNIFNLLGILGVAALMRPLDTAAFEGVDVLVMGAFAVVLWPLLRTGRRLGRTEGLILMTAYAAYVGYLVALHT